MDQGRGGAAAEAGALPPGGALLRPEGRVAVEIHAQKAALEHPAAQLRLELLTHIREHGTIFSLYPRDEIRAMRQSRV
jgi:hypothetical protein